MGTIEIEYLIGFVIATVVRKYFTGRFNPAKERSSIETVGTVFDKTMLGFIGLTMLLPVINIWIDLFPFAYYQGLEWIQRLGILIFYSSIFLLFRSHNDLGKNWNPQTSTGPDQTLVQSGVYKKIRHPMYTAHLLWAFANALIFSNWIVGPAMLIATVIFLPQRIKREERLMEKRFGSAYIAYKNSSYKIFPGF